MKLKTDCMDDSPAVTGGASGKGVYDPMSNENMTRNTAPTPVLEQDAPALVKKNGKTTYKVRVHFSTTSTETMSDKIKRMLKHEIQDLMNAG